MLLAPLAALTASEAARSDAVREMAGLPTEAERLGLPEMQERLAALLGLQDRVSTLEGASVVGDVAMLQAQLAELNGKTQGIETRVATLETSDQQNVKQSFLEERLAGFKTLIFEELDLDGKLANFKTFLLEDLDLDGRFENFKTYLLEDLDLDGRFNTLRTEIGQIITNMQTQLGQTVTDLQTRFNQFVDQRFPWVEDLTTAIRDGYNNLIRNINSRLGLNLPVIESPPPPKP